MGAAESNTIRIGTQGTGTGQQNKAFVAGVSGATSSSGVAVLVNASGQLGTTTSSRRFKQDIHPLASQADALMALQPVSFYYKPQYIHGQPNVLEYGLIAEDVARTYPALVAYGSDGKPYSVRYQELPVLLLAQAQRDHAALGREHARADRQQRRLQAQARRLRHLQAQINWLMRHARLR